MWKLKGSYERGRRGKKDDEWVKDVGNVLSIQYFVVLSFFHFLLVANKAEKETTKDRKKGKRKEWLEKEKLCGEEEESVSIGREEKRMPLSLNIIWFDWWPGID